ncbi:MAG: metallophosphoesterase [Deltaproteobacteria bacterium]|nr:metallophosphoesterase [Deltaproteobacteria bacterium]
MAVAPEQIVVVSDIHLGEDLIQKGPPSLQHYINRLNEQFVAFVDWLRERPKSGPIDLVINGDMFDFVKISLRPDPREAYMRWQQGLSATEKRHGLDNSPERVEWKLERILESHRPAFISLAELVGDGNRLHIVAGNHDREFYYPEIVTHLRRALSDLYFSRHRVQDTAAARAAFSARLDFSMWFHVTQGGVYIEHGHQYDPYCSFEYLLAPRKRPEEMKVALPLTHKAIPYFADLMGDMSTHNLDTRGLGYYFRMLFRMGPKRVGVLLWAYVRAVASILREAGGKGREARRALESEHLTERSEVATKYALSEPQIHALDALHATPAEFSLMKMIQCFYVDRFALAFVVLVGLALQTWLLDDRLWRFSAFAVTIVAAALVSEWLGTKRRFDTRQFLREGAAGVARTLRSRVVIFGHSHKPEVVALDGGAHYINIGSWISRAALLGESAWGMTFAWIGPQSGGGASGLYRWVGTKREAKLVHPLGGEPAADEAPELAAASAS